MFSTLSGTRPRDFDPLSGTTGIPDLFIWESPRVHAIWESPRERATEMFDHACPVEPYESKEFSQ